MKINTKQRLYHGYLGATVDIELRFANAKDGLRIMCLALTSYEEFGRVLLLVPLHVVTSQALANCFCLIKEM